jgi:hypothetical protein
MDEEGEEVCADPNVEFDVEDSFPHPAYSLTHLQNDVGLIRIKGTANFRSGESLVSFLGYFTMPNVTENSNIKFPMPRVDSEFVYTLVKAYACLFPPCFPLAPLLTSSSLTAHLVYRITVIIDLTVSIK